MTEKPDTFLLYGATDTGKTAQLGEFAQWEHQRTGMISRLISADPAGWDSIEHLIISADNPNGIIEAWDVQALLDPWAVFVKLGEGAWPVVVAKNGSYGTRLVGAVRKDNRIVSRDGRLVGQYFIEGLDSVAEVLMRDHMKAQRPTYGRDVGSVFSSEVVILDKDGKELREQLVLGSSAAGYVGQIQRWLAMTLFPKFSSLQGVNRVVWTGHEARGDDEISGVKRNLLGPETVGKATVGSTTEKFGHTFHMTTEASFGLDKERNRVVARRDFRAWFISHPDKNLTTMNWPARVCLRLSEARRLLKEFPGGYIPLRQEGMTKYLNFLYGSPAEAQAGQEPQAQPEETEEAITG